MQLKLLEDRIGVGEEFAHFLSPTVEFLFELPKSHLGGTHAFRLKLLQRHKTKAYVGRTERFRTSGLLKNAFSVTLQRV